ncbi:GGDEF domain-containing protein [Pelagibaculum spongiae]|uniref:diguanylate cyclase n=1 Tax=Pelagibaculum spongiae TaxID=2080658 RepID=A0A2V1GXZ4_9GAMM|nr:GGDEF domain-containing protein [Pelagibaculum spongiae]PVZ70513.1 hypothetical protein DC094_07990 [Pelagibaculum spongiae]
MQPTTRPTENWRRKYLQQLKQFETEEQQWKKEINLLCKSLRRVMLAVETDDQQLSLQLDELKQILGQKLDVNRLSLWVDVSADELIAYEKRMGKRNLTIRQKMASMIGMLQSIKLSFKMRRRLKQLAVQVDAATCSEMPDLLTSLAHCLKESLTELAPEQEQEQGFWQRLLNKEPERNEHGELIDSDNPADASLPESILNQLLRLMDELSMPKLLAHHGDTLRDQLEQEPSLRRLPGLLEEMVDLLLDAHKDEQENLASFLASVNSRLEILLDLQSRYLESGDKSLADQKILGRLIQREVDGIKVTLQETPGMHQLQTEVSDRLNKIVFGMDQLQKRQVHRNRKNQDEVEELQQKLNFMLEQGKEFHRRLMALQQESVSLRTELQTQREQAELDGLTGLPNRRSYEARIALEYRRWKNSQQPCSMLVCDIDHFKLINDQLGHQAGDIALTYISKLLRGRLRQSDFVARYGGEEFVLLLPSTDIKQAAVVAETIRELVEVSDFRYHDKPVSVTISIGCAEFVKGETVDGTFSRADQALYLAKETGRNRVEVAKNRG